MALSKVNPEQGPGHGDTTAAATAAAPPHTESKSTQDASTSASKSHSQKDGASPQYPHHVIFVVHGMGRQLEEYGNYERNVGYLVENTKTVLQSTFHELQTNVHIIPIEWHAKLHSLVDERMALTSLKTVPKVRMVMNDYLADILYYFNGHFGNVMIRMIVDELNEAYEAFMAKYPDFNGKISVFALSLGGVAMFDILTCLDDDDEDKKKEDAIPTGKDVRVDQDGDAEMKVPDQTNPTSAAKSTASTSNNSSRTIKKGVRKQEQTKFRATVPKLLFRPHYLFTVGSPVGAVMVMRNLDWETFHPPDDIIHHNLFHPFDPLGYRIEPLIDPVFAGIPAVLMNSYSNSQALFSLPSLPSLSLPGSISSFWENKVPTLPRPTIPGLSSLSQMTQSLKAGRWLSGNTTATATAENAAGNTGNGGEEEEDSGVSTPTAESGQDEDDDANAEVASSPASSVDYGLVEVTKEEEEKEEQQQKEDDMIVDADASATEYMAAATVATCLAPREPSNATDVSSASTAVIDTTTTGPSTTITQPSTKRRPSLGPRRVSSRVEEEQGPINKALKQQQQQQQQYSELTEVAEEGVGSTKVDSDITAHQDEESSSSSSGLTPSPLDIEYYLGMETGATAQEKAQGLGAKSDVVQESMVRSVPTSPAAAQDQKQSYESSLPAQTEKNGHQGTIAQEEEDVDEAKKQERRTGRSATVRVEGRVTKVPYRIDHVLQESTADQYTNEYLLGMRSHFRYWGNRDVAYHILRTMLHPAKDPSAEEEVLDLKLDMPAPVMTTKGAKEAAEAKAKATATAARSRNGSSASDHEAKKQNRKSFTFPFFGGYDYSFSDDSQAQQQQQALQRQRDEEQRRQQEEADEDLSMMGEEGELFGYRYTEAGANPVNAVRPRLMSMSSSSSSLFKMYSGDGVDAAETNRGSKRRISTYYAKDKASTGHLEDGSSFVHGRSLSSGSTTSAAEGWVPAPVPSVPELTRPAKLHHRPSRVEEKQ
ncbi:hypothetical protein EDD11_002072 [Mortierella claussenii]|nr:hypothetical protein EDD11_002072 [Mortierella claussenii]